MKRKPSAIDVRRAPPHFEKSLFEGIEFSHEFFDSHVSVARALQNTHPFTITILIESLDPDLWNDPRYVQKTRIPRDTKYAELLFTYFFREFGEDGGQRVYAEWLENYRDQWNADGRIRELDDYIRESELEPRYRKVILKKYPDSKSLFRPRYRVQRERHYVVPPPLARVDWRNPYDNLFLWEEHGKRYAIRGGSGSSGQRERNSLCILGFSLLNQERPVPSHLFVYSEKNELLFIRRFSSLTIPRYDIGSNYPMSSEEMGEVLKGTRLLEWDMRSVLHTIQYAIV